MRPDSWDWVDPGTLWRLMARATPGHPGYDFSVATSVDEARFAASIGNDAGMRFYAMQAITVSLLIDRNERNGGLVAFDRAKHDACLLVGLDPARPLAERTWHEQLSADVDADHSCTDRSCDIGEANRNGFPHVAAALLIGATEAPHTSEVLAHYGLPIDLRRAHRWADWLDHHHRHGHPCAGCGAFTYSDDEETVPDCCGACGLPLAAQCPQ